MQESLPFTEQNLRQLAGAGYRFIAVDENERRLYVLQRPLTSGSLASLEWKQYQIESEMTNRLLQSAVYYELHVISDTAFDAEP